MPAPQFVVNSNRFDPYKDSRFLVLWDGKPVMGVSKVSGLIKTTASVKHRSGGDPLFSRKSPSTTETKAITLERGITHDPEFEKWASKVWDTEAAAAGTISLKDFRRDITIQLLNEQGNVAMSYIVFNCWVSEYQALPQLDANAGAVAIEHIILENEGWTRDKSFTEPEETAITPE